MRLNSLVFMHRCGSGCASIFHQSYTGQGRADGSSMVEMLAEHPGVTAKEPLGWMQRMQVVQKQSRCRLECTSGYG